MSGPYGPNDTSGEGHGSDPTPQWTGQPSSGAEPTQQWTGQQPQWGQQAQWGQPGQQPCGQQATGSADPTQQWTGQQQQPWGQQSSPSWPQQPAAQPAAWDPTQQQWTGQQQPWEQPQPGQWGQQPGQPISQPSLQISKKRSRKGLLFGGIGALVVVVVVIVLAFVFLSSNNLDNSAVQQGVQKVLKDSYGIDDVQDVSCPSGQEVKVGKSFNCSMKVGGEQKTVTVKITKSDGTYEVGRPN